jgi:hypothetical protein
MQVHTYIDNVVHTTLRYSKILNCDLQGVVYIFLQDIGTIYQTTR